MAIFIWNADETARKLWHIKLYPNDNITHKDRLPALMSVADFDYQMSSFCVDDCHALKHEIHEPIQSLVNRHPIQALEV